MSQRYISKELTHFVGAAFRNEERQYALLRDILHRGILKSSRYSERGGGLLYASLAEPDPLGETTLNTAVCFCDIPVADLQFHSSKYSKFGLAFTKRFLVGQGANPAFYVAKDSVTLPLRKNLFDFGKPVDDDRAKFQEPSGREVKKRAAYFEYWRGAHHQMCYRLEHGDSAVAQQGYGFMRGGWVADYSEFVNLYVFGFIKYFDPDLLEDEPKNFYMEREWRLLNFARFGLDDVVRILIPAAFARQFRKDVPDYCGQVTFIE